MTSASSPQITELLQAWSAGKQSAVGQIIELVYPELHRIARNHLYHERREHSIQATALVNEAYLRLTDYKRMRWQNRAHFFGFAARLMRNALVDHARARRAVKRGGGLEALTLESIAVICPDRTPDILEVDEALDELAKVDERKAKVIELRYFGGMINEEIAAALDLSLSTVTRDLRLGAAWLRRFLAGENPV